MTRDEQDSIRAEFASLVNMTPATLRKWLATEDSRSVGVTPGGEKVTGGGHDESVGHHMGERILAIQAAKAADLTDQDYHDMRKVIGYVHRHSKQRPGGDVTHNRWRKSWMNWGHDPLKDR